MNRRALHAATLPRSFRRLDAGTAAASLLAHGGLLLAIALLDPHSSFPILAREIPVELVSEPAAPEKRQVVAGASEKSPAQPVDTGTALQQQSGIDWESKAANKPRSSAVPGQSPPRRRGTWPFVFSTTGGHKPISGFSKLKARLDSGIPEKIASWRFHDLRRSMRTGLSMIGVSDTVSELCIAHAQKGLHRGYDQYSYLAEKRQALDRWDRARRAQCNRIGDAQMTKKKFPVATVEITSQSAPAADPDLTLVLAVRNRGAIMSWDCSPEEARDAEKAKDMS